VPFVGRGNRLRVLAASLRATTVSKGLEIIPAKNVEVTLAVPPYIDNKRIVSCLASPQWQKRDDRAGEIYLARGRRETFCPAGWFRRSILNQSEKETVLCRAQWRRKTENENGEKQGSHCA